MVQKITAEEISAITDGYSESLRENLVQAARRLNFSLKYIHAVESWRELLELFRAECVGPWLNVMVDGVLHRAYVDEGDKYIHEHDFRYNNLGPALRQLHEAMLAIENFKPAEHDSKILRTYVGVVTGRLHDGCDTMAEAKKQIQAEYIGAKRGTGKKIKAKICADCDISPRTFDNYVAQVKREISRNRPLRK